MLKSAMICQVSPSRSGRWIADDVELRGVEAKEEMDDVVEEEFEPVSVANKIQTTEHLFHP